MLAKRIGQYTKDGILVDQDKPKIDRYGLDFNHEGYRDSTAAAAIRNVMKDERVR